MTASSAEPPIRNVCSLPTGMRRRRMSETAEEMHKRLIAVMAAARFEALSQPHAWLQIDTLLKLPAGALACVRDGSTWYALAPGSTQSAGAYSILGFHFAEGTNASGFVAWLEQIPLDLDQAR